MRDVTAVGGGRGAGVSRVVGRKGDVRCGLNMLVVLACPGLAKTEQVANLVSPGLARTGKEINLARPGEGRWLPGQRSTRYTLEYHYCNNPSRGTVCSVVT